MASRFKSFFALVAFIEWLNKYQHTRPRQQLAIKMGTGTHIPSLRHSSHRIIYEYNSRLIQINPTDSKIPPKDIGLKIGALKALRLIDAELLSRWRMRQY